MSNRPAHPVDLFDERRRLVEQFPVVHQAFGTGGRQAHLVTGLGSAQLLGSFVVIDDESDEPLVAQVQSHELAERAVGQLDALADLETADGPVTRSVTITPMVRFVRSELTVLGRLGADGSFRRDVPVEGFAECRFRAATDDETRSVRAALAGSAPTLAVGELVGAPAVEARVRSAGFSRHTFLCGQSGSGKTYATGVLLERLRLGTDLPLVILDPNSDHVHLGELRPDAADAPEAVGYRAIADDVLVARSRGHEGVLLAIHFSELASREQMLLLGLDPVADLGLSAAFREAVDGLAAPFSVADVRDAAAALGTDVGRDLATRIDNLEVASWGVWCRPGERSIVESAPLQRRCVVVDLGSLERSQERTLVALAVLRVLWARRAEKKPVLLVVDEAHNAFPAQPANALEAAATAVGVSIAAEGRKYGLHLLLATQRPSKVEANIVTQCDNLVLLRVNSTADVADLCRTFSHVPPGLIAQAPEFGLGELLIAGPVAEVAIRARIGRRLSPEGGGDLPTGWATPAER
ncbi:MAG: ATP-binding protein [Acidimicrobiales bacterium]